MQKDKDVYIPGATLDDLLSIYHFDKNVKSIFFRKIVKIEATMRSIIAYRFSEKYPGSYTYLDSTNFDKKPLKVAKYLSNVAFIISKNLKNKNPSILHYYTKYNEIPLWVLMNSFEFGALENFYSLMKDSDKNRVAKDFSDKMNQDYGEGHFFTPIQIISYLKNLRLIRNICAHDNRLLGYNAPPNMVFSDRLFLPYSIQRQTPRQNIYCSYITMRLFLSKGQYDLFTNSLKKRMDTLEKHLKRSNSPILINDILSSIGFPDDWHNI